MKLLQMGKGVYQQYQNTVKGNRDVSYPLAQKKLTRNTMLALQINVDPDSSIEKKLYLYGNLHIYVEGNKIIWIKNHYGGENWFWKDEKKYNELNRKLGITRAETLQQRKVG